MHHVTYTDERTCTSLVRTTQLICAEDIISLAEGPLLALRLPHFFPIKLCDEFTPGIISHPETEYYAVAPDIKKIGKAIFDAASDPLALDNYYENAPRALQQIRQFFHPYLSPMDKLRLILQEAWLPGAIIENLHGKPMFCGLVRAFHGGAEARPHQDMTHWDVPESAAAQTLATQIACNVYLETAIRGGELELWDYGITDPTEYSATQTEDDYGLNRQKIASSSVRVSPAKGELILFNARRIHAVNRIDEGVRVAVSSFIGYRGQSECLTIFS